MIHFEQKANSKIKQFINSGQLPEGYHLRLARKGSVCESEFVFGFDKRNTLDELFEIEGISVLIPKADLMFLIGKEVFWQSEGDEGFFGLK